ncbi:hypothetical protein AAK899_10710 [Erysipelotrichaceae bacterium 51-3]
MNRSPQCSPKLRLNENRALKKASDRWLSGAFGHFCSYGVLNLDQDLMNSGVEVICQRFIHFERIDSSNCMD